METIEEVKAELAKALIMLKERHVIAMSLMYEADDPNTHWYLKSSPSGEVTKMLEKHGISTNEIPGKMI